MPAREGGVAKLRTGLIGERERVSLGEQQVKAKSVWEGVKKWQEASVTTWREQCK